MSEKLTNRQVRSIKKMMENKGRRQQLKAQRGARPPEPSDQSRRPRRNDWDEADEDYYTREKIRRAERAKPAPRATAAHDFSPDPDAAGTVIEVRSGDSLVMYRGRTVRATLPKGVRASDGTRSPLAVGDRVELEPAPGGDAVRIASIAPRRSGLSRDVYEAGRRDPTHVSQVLAANIDLAVVVCSPAEPPYRPRLLDRYLVAASRDGLEAAICLNKTDLGVPDETAASLAGYERLGIRVLRCSAETGDGIGSVRDCIAGKVSLFTGHSGVGKSSLLNALEPGLALRVGEVTETKAGQGKGRHTTSSARLVPLSVPDTFVVDSPGIRAFGVRGLPPRELAAHFPDIDALASGCAFGNCRHRAEPDCAVRAAAHLDPFLKARVASCKVMLAELER